MANDLKEKIFSAFETLIITLRPFVKTIITESYPNGIWEAEFYKRLKPKQQEKWNQNSKDKPGIDPLNLIDFNNIIFFPDNFWNEINRHLDGRNVAKNFKSYINIITELRNDFFHDFSLPEEKQVNLFSNIIMLADELELFDLKEEIIRLRASTAKPIKVVSEIKIDDETDMTRGKSQEEDTGKPMMQWFENLRPHSDIREGVLDESVFAANLNDVVKQEGPEVYLNPGIFFQKTSPTAGMKDIAKRVVKALNGEATENRVISLQTGFGGGKTHSLIALFHTVKAGKNISNITDDILVANDLPKFNPGEAKIAVFTQNTCDVTYGRTVKEGFTIYTMWGEIAYQLGGVEAYETLKKSDIAKVAPSAEIFEPILKKAAPALILIDELADYCNKASGVPVSNSTLYAQTLSFIQTLTESISKIPRTALLATLPASATEVSNTALGEEILTALQNRVVRIGTSIKPVEDDEMFDVVRRRLFESIESEEEMDKVALRYKNMYHNQRANLPAGSDGMEYAKKIKKSYPFHPELIDIFRLRWANDSRFQRTRGALQLLASIVQYLWKNRENIRNTQALIHTTDINLKEIPILTGRITSLVGSQWDSVMQADVYGVSSNAYRIDNLDKASEIYKYNLTQGLATTILLATIIGDREHRSLSIKDLKLFALRPNAYDHNFIDTATNRLEEVAHYLYSSTIGGKKYWFQSKPNVNILFTQAKQEVTDAEVNAEIVDRLNNVKNNLPYGMVPQVLVTPSGDVPEQKQLTLVIVPPSLAVKTGEHLSKSLEDYISRIAFKKGNSDRIYRNTILYLTATEHGLAILSKKVKEYLAAKKVAFEYGMQLDSDQKKDISGREKQFDSEIGDAILRAYSIVIKCSRKDGCEMYQLKSFSGDLFSQIRFNLLDELKEEEWVVDSMGRSLLAKHNLFPSVEDPKKLSDIYEAFLRYDDKPMITGQQAILNTAQKLCHNGQVNIGIGNQDKWENIFTNQEVNYLSINPGEDYYLIDESVVMKQAQADDDEKTPIDSDTTSNGADSGSSVGSSTTTNEPEQPQPQVRTFKKVTIQGNIPIENWTQLYTSFINTLLKNKLNIEVKFTAENTGINPLTDNSQLIKNLRESASQLGLHINTEE